jgi:hypothetical protein
MVLLLMGICGVLEGNDNRFSRRVDCSGGYQAYWRWLGGKTTGGYGVFTPTGKESKSHEAHPLAYRYYLGGMFRSFSVGEFWQRQLGFRYSLSSPVGCYS